MSSRSCSRKKKRSSSTNQDDQSTNCIDFCLSRTPNTRFMYAPQDSSLVRHFWRCCRAGTCTAQRSPGCRTGCVCDKHKVNKAGKHAKSGTTTDPASPPSTCTFLLNSAVRHASWKGESCRFAKKEPAERKTTARIENETLGWAGLQHSGPMGLCRTVSPNHQHSENGVRSSSVVTSAVFPTCLIRPCGFLFLLIYSHKRTCLKAF